MSIAILTQVYDEMRRLSVAGSVTAAGDVRLKKFIPPLEQAGAKAPVFAKVAQAVKALVEATEKTSAPALLELCTLVNAVLSTQGETGCAGTWTEIETIDLGPQTAQVSAGVFKPLLDALTTTGSGRLEIIEDAIERGAFRDLRLVKPALDAIDDPSPDIADLIAKKALPLYGKAILSVLKSGFDLKSGKRGQLRRLALMHHLDPSGTREVAKQALEEGSKEMKIAALECLGDSSEDLPFLLEHSVAKSKDVRRAAFKALANQEADAAIEALRKAIMGDDLDLVIEPMSEGSKTLQKMLADAHATLPPGRLGHAFEAACQSMEPAEVFDAFSPYLRAKVDEKKKERDPAWAKRAAIIEAITRQRWRRTLDELTRVYEDGTWDPRWLDVAVEIGNGELTCRLARSSHEGCKTLLSKLWREWHEARTFCVSIPPEAAFILQTMIRIEHPDAISSVITAIKLLVFGETGIHFNLIDDLIRQLPKTALAPLEALLPTLRQQKADRLSPALTELKNKP
jgi:hypothetical protein